MKLQKLFFIAFIFLLSVNFCAAQTKDKSAISPEAARFVKSSPAYAETLLYKTELEAEREDLLVSYTAEFPKVQEVEFKLKFIKLEMDKFFNVEASESQKLTLALGKLIVRKVELEADLWTLKKKYGNEHPEVKKAEKRVLIFQTAINNIIF